MNLIEQLKAMSKTSYKDYEGDEFQVKLKSGMTEAEINKVKEQIPNRNLPKDLEELLKYSRGFENPTGFLEEVNFDDINVFGFEELIQNNLTLTHDGAGNFWVQEINQKGEWGQIFYVCHDPAVLVKQAENLKEFLEQIHECLLKDDASFLSKVIDKISGDIYMGKGKILEQSEAIKSSDKLLSNFASNYDEDWFIADLRNAKNGEGFRLEASFKNTIRLDNELIWALKKYKSIWRRMRIFFKIK